MRNHINNLATVNWSPCGWTRTQHQCSILCSWEVLTRVDRVLVQWEVFSGSALLNNSHWGYIFITLHVLPCCLFLLFLLSQEMISRQMNSVFKELLSRQPTAQQSTITAPAATAAPAASSSSSSSSLPQAAPTGKKVGFGLRGRALFRPVD